MSKSPAKSADASAAVRTSSTDNLLKLYGHLDSNGVARLEPNPRYTPSSSSNPPRSLKVALDGAGDLRRDSSGYATSESSEEDYDALKPEASAVIVGGKGGGFNAEAKPQAAANGTRTYEELKLPAKKRPVPSRLKSIPVTLNKLQGEGRYILTADDETLREILRDGIERACSAPRFVLQLLTTFRSVIQERREGANLVI